MTPKATAWGYPDRWGPFVEPDEGSGAMLGLPTDDELTSLLLKAGFTHCFGIPYRVPVAALEAEDVAA